MTTPSVALSATDGSLLRRVQRLLGGPDERPVAGWSAAVVAVLLLSAALLPASLASPRVDAQSADQISRVAPVRPSDGADAVTSGLREAESPTSQPREDQIAAMGTTAKAAWLDTQIRSARTALTALKGQFGEQSLEVQRMSRMVAELERLDPAATYSRIPAVLAEGRQVSPEDELKAARERLLQFERSRAELREQRVRVEREKADSDMKARREAWNAELEVLRKEADRIARQIQQGTARPEQGADVQARIALVERDARLAEAEIKFQLAIGEIESREVEHAEQYQRLRDEYVTLLAREHEEQLKANQAREAAAAANVRREQAIERPGQRRPASSGPVATRAAVAGDLLEIVIAGEPELPSSYIVAADGTIKLPLLGAIPVQGLTAGQIERAIGREIASRRRQSNFVGAQLQDAYSRLSNHLRAGDGRETSEIYTRDLRTLVSLVEALESKLEKEMQADNGVQVVLR
jgi:hypothetical protein